ncbi:MAG: hypothetical protein ACE5II_02920 [Anaerolineae bacterium]
MWGLGNRKRRLLALTIAAAAMLVLGALPLRGDVAHDDRLDQDPKIYLPLVMRRYCSDWWRDDFSDPNSGWLVLDDEASKLEYLSGEFHVVTKIPHWSINFSPWPPVYATDFILGVDGRSDLGTYGLVFGERIEGWQFYSFEIEPGGYWAIHRIDGGSSVLDSGHSPYITSGMNRLKIVREGSLIEAYVNGHLLSAVTDSSFLGSRKVGLMAGAKDAAPVDAYFDNFAVCPVDSVPGAGAPGIGEAVILQKGTPPTIEFWPR